jgi:predicted XRE-type DNA-binding protein
MEKQVFEDVWDAIEDSPSEAANMTVRSDLLIAIQQTVDGWGITQTEAAARLGVTQPRLNDMIKEDRAPLPGRAVQSRIAGGA